LAAVGGFFGNLWDRATYVPKTVWVNTATDDYSLVGRIYVTAGTTVGSLVGVTQISDAGADHDAVDGHLQTTGERVFKGISGTVQLGTLGWATGAKVTAAIIPAKISIPAPTTLLSVPGRVQSRINLSNNGWGHLVARHFSGKTNASQFTVTQAELRGILQSKQVVGSPVSRTLQSADGLRYIREIDLGRQIGLDKFANLSPTNMLSVVSDKFGNIITAFPGILK